MKKSAAKLASLVFVGWLQAAMFTAVCYGEAGAGSPDAAPADAPEIYRGVGPADTLWMMVKVIFFLLLIIGIFYAIMKFISKKNMLTAGRAFRSLGGIPLGQNKSVQIVEIGKAIYIVGVGQDIRLLEKIDDEESVSELLDMMASSPAGSGVPFGSAVGWLKGLRNKANTEEEEIDVSATFQQVFHNKMQNMTDRKKMLEDMLMEDNKTDRLNDKR